MSAVFDHPWLGGLFGDEEAALIWSAERQVDHMLAFEAAFARALGQVGVVTKVVANAAADRIGALQPDISDLRVGTARDGLPIPALVRELRQKCGSNADAVHSGATSQDVIDTALSLTLREFNNLLAVRLEGLKQQLESLSRRFGDRSLMGRTRMQAAVPITVADRLASWSLPLGEHLVRLDQLRPRVELLQLGGAAGDCAALSPHGGAIAADMAGRLGLTNPLKAWHAMRDGVVEYANLLSLVSGTLGKMGQDICLMSQQGIDEVSLSGGGGSSAMPHKQNPVLAELLVTLARYNATQISGMHQAMVHEQERSGAAWMLEWMILPGLAQATARNLTAASEICGQIAEIGTRAAC